MSSLKEAHPEKAVKSTGFKKLLEPGYIRNVRTRNRIYKTAAAMHCDHEDEMHMSAITLGFYETLARGGAGLIVVEAPTIDYPMGARWRERYRFDEDRFITGMAELVEAIHRHGCPTFMQMEHDGPWQSPLFDVYGALFDGPPIAASPVNIPNAPDFHRDMPRQLTIREIETIIRKFIDAAVRARKAGFDGVDINCGSSHLIHNFLSPFWNRRDDEYGGTPEKRGRFMVEIIKGIKAQCGKEFPVVACLNGFEVGQAIGIDDETCLTHDLATRNVLMTIEAGADAIMIRSQWLGLHVAGFLPDYMFYPEEHIPLDRMPKVYYSKKRGLGAMRLMTKEYKKLVDVPIIIVGYVTPELGERMLEKGEADFIGMNRSLMCDPDLPRKLAEGRKMDVAPCTHCGTCLGKSDTGSRRCRLNAGLGLERYYGVDKNPRKKKVVIVGGGPAGMEAARVSALRGHDVTLIEKSHRLGGLLPLAALIKGIELENLTRITRYLKIQLMKLGVRVELGQEATRPMIQKMKPDVVIVATGGILTSPNINGLRKNVVLTTPELHRRVKPYLAIFGPRILGWLTRYLLPIGKRVVVIGAGIYGCEVTEFLVKRGRKVTIVEPSDKVGEGVIDFRFGLLMSWFNRKEVKIVTATRDIEIVDKGLAYKDKKGERHIIPADTIVPTSPLKANRSLFEDLKGIAPELLLIGDARQSGMIVDAVRGAYQAARSL